MYTVYILQCEDGTLYTGVAKDARARFRDHVAGTGARYTRAHRPVRIVYTERTRSRASAQRREYIIKQLTRKQKLALFS